MVNPLTFLFKSLTIVCTSGSSGMPMLSKCLFLILSKENPHAKMEIGE